MSTTIGSAGRVRFSEVDTRVVATNGLDNSYCLICAHWFFGEHLATCPRCRHFIYQWVPTCDLYMLRAHSTLRRL
jgi:hypothetical protein